MGALTSSRNSRIFFEYLNLKKNVFVYGDYKPSSSGIELDAEAAVEVDEVPG